MKIPGYLTPPQVADLIYVSDKKIDPNATRLNLKRISALGQANKWGYDMLGRNKLYDEQDVRDWLVHRKRGLIQMMLKGNQNHKPIDNDIYDFDCPECDCLALPLWPDTLDDGIAWLGGKLSLPWMCENGHRGRSLL